MGEATLRLIRGWGGVVRNEPWDIAIDGKVVGVLASHETVEVVVAPGEHTVRLGHGRHISPVRSFEVAEEEVVSYHCHGVRYGWPQLLAALIKPDLWISLRRG